MSSCCTTMVMGTIARFCLFLKPFTRSSLFKIALPRFRLPQRHFIGASHLTCHNCQDCATWTLSHPLSATSRQLLNVFCAIGVDCAKKHAIFLARVFLSPCCAWFLAYKSSQSL